VAYRNSANKVRSVMESADTLKDLWFGIKRTLHIVDLLIAVCVVILTQIQMLICFCPFLP